MGAASRVAYCAMKTRRALARRADTMPPGDRLTRRTTPETDRHPTRVAMAWARASMDREGHDCTERRDANDADQESLGAGHITKTQMS